MKFALLFYFLLLSHFPLDTFAETDHVDSEPAERDSKLLPIFQVVRFPNDICSGTSRNGTCYTSEECSNKGGTSDGSCASGFGVCCVFTLACGGSASENQTYLVQASSTSISSPCLYTICPCSTNICRIRYDFTSFVIGAQTTGQVKSAGDTVTNIEAIGSCAIDNFSITAPGATGSPIICGTNTGYHMVLDVGSSSSCQQANFQIGASTTTSRYWDIKITQYACGNEDAAGPPGCLQYFTGTSGNVASYGFPPTITTSAAMTSTITHLKNQRYTNCFRRETGYCYICYQQSITATTIAVITQNSFGISVADAAAADSARIGTNCSNDYIQIAGGNTAAIAATTSTASVASRFCGRRLNTANAGTADISICSRINPFQLGVVFDDDEVKTTADAANTDEEDMAPGGIVGFKLNWVQKTC